MKKITEELFEQQDLKYRDFLAALIPQTEKECVIGVRTPVLREMAGKMRKNGEAETFLGELPHEYFEENQLHAFLLSEEKNYETLMDELDRFLPCVDNWATCDQLRPKILKKHTKELFPKIRLWITDDKTYTIRFAIEMLMCHYLDTEYRSEYLAMAAAVKSDDYYVNMMIAWYFATALAKQWEDVLPYIEERKLPRWVHNKTIQKAVESRRISDSRKEFLRGLRWK